MPNSNYYREQASLLFKLSLAASRGDVAERLMKRAQEMATLAQDNDDASEQATSEEMNLPPQA
jgi:hypothetical protein